MSDFAPPLNKLDTSGIGVAAAPTGGMGFALTPDGKLPAGVLFVDDKPRRIDFGYSGTLTTDGAGHATVTHGLGTTPACTLTMSDTAISTRPVVTTSHNTTTVDAFFNAAGVSVAFWWLVIG